MPDNLTFEQVNFPTPLLERRHDKGASLYTVKLCPSHGIPVDYVSGELPLERLHSRYYCQ